MWQLRLEDVGVLPNRPSSLQAAPPHCNASPSLQQNPDDTEQAIDALLAAQHLFKLEMEKQWEKLQMAAARLELRHEGLRHGQQEGATKNAGSFTANGSPIPDVADAKDSGDKGGRSTDFEETGNECINGDARHALNGTQVVVNRASCSTDDGVEVLASNRNIQTLMLNSRLSQTNDFDKDEYAAFEQAECEEQAQDAAMEAQESKWRRWLKSPHFDMLVGFTIILNLILIMVRIQYEGQIHEPGFAKPRSSVMDAVIEVLEHFFTVFFLLELVLRLFANGVGYLRSISNGIDALIVVGSCLDSWVLRAVMGGSATRSLSMLRVFRLLRLMKVLRVVRVMKAFTQLRVLVQAVLSSVGALVWSMTLLFVLEILGAILFAQSLQPIIKDETRELQLREKLWTSFGTMARSWLTLFEITMAPGSFLQHRYLYDEVHAGFTVMLITYVCFVTFAVIRVISALFLKKTLEASDSESRQQDSFLRKRRLAYAKRLCRALEEARGDDPGEARIDAKGLVKLLTYKRLTDWLDDAGLGMEDAARLFKALDTGDGLVALEEFLAAISQISDSAGVKDFILRQENTTILDVVRHMKHVWQVKLERPDESI